MSTYSNWREDLIEVIDTPTTEKKAEKKIKETKVNNKVVINPTFKESVAAMGGKILEMKEVDNKDDKKDDRNVEQKEKAKQEREDKNLKAKEKRVGMAKRMILQKKVQAVRAGAGADITAGYEPEGEMVEASAVLDANKKIGDNEKREKMKKELIRLMKHAKDKRSDINRESVEPESGIVEGDVHSGQGEKIQKRTKAWMDKKGQKGAPGLDAMKARTAEHKAKRGVKEEVVDEGLGASMAVTAGLNAVGNIAKAYGASQAAKGAIVGGALSGAGALGGGVLNYMASRNNNKKKSDVKPQEKKKEVKEGVMKMVKKVMSKKKPEKKKATMDAITSKVHDWRKRNSDKQKEHEKYVNFLPVDEAKVDDVKYSKDEKRKNYETDVHTLSVNKGVRADRNKRRSATDVIFHGHSKVERDRKQAHYKSRGVKTKGVKEDKAFEFVKNKLKAKYGDGVLATGEKMKPPTAAQKKAAAAHQAKVDAENAAERAKDPSQGRYPRG